MSKFFDQHGEPLTLSQWAALLDIFEYRYIARTKISDEVEVSTVWLGLDHNFWDGPPMIFETMIFGGDHDQECLRYSTLEQAQAGHVQVVASLAAALN